MKIIKDVKQDEIWNHWKTVEGFTTDDFRSDIRNPLPDDLDWVLAIVEKGDVDLLFIKVFRLYHPENFYPYWKIKFVTPQFPITRDCD